MSLYSGLEEHSLGVGILLIFLTYRYVSAYRVWVKFQGIPTLGYDGVLMSYITAWRRFKEPIKLYEEGCRKYPGGAFKIPTFTGWKVVVNGPHMINDIRRATDDELSFEDAAADTLEVDYTMSPKLHINSYHINIVRTPLTRNIGARFDDIVDETFVAFADHIPLQDDWVEVPVLKTAQNIIVRISNRFFVGLPLCRDPDWCDLNIQFTINVAVNSSLIKLFPKFLHPIVGNIFTTRKRSMRQALKLVGPIIKHRLEMEEEHGKDWEDRPNDAISWAIDTVNQIGDEWQKKSVEDICLRLLAINFAAIHTTSMAFTHALYLLAANTHLIAPLRNEVETVIKKEGWTKTAMVQLRLMDSFLKESQRREGTSPLGMGRETLKDFRFSDGTVVPAGIMIEATIYETHHDEETYPDPNDFIPSRFADMRAKEGEGMKHQMVTPTREWVLFGTGKHACPGRFFAVAELKTMFAHLLMNYDVKFKDNEGYPPPFVFGGVVSPNQNAKVMFRKRRDGA
ncbi:hypothetical protein AAF712_004809 [Marasmius tenuissimus]|uniref:Cytochrome P450 n=1 Tax=Marasmius tenuissimus TaxID=585030 RepID=A0ABR3A441_9AGAR